MISQASSKMDDKKKKQSTIRTTVKEKQRLLKSENEKAKKKYEDHVSWKAKRREEQLERDRRFLEMELKPQERLQRQQTRRNQATNLTEELLRRRSTIMKEFTMSSFAEVMINSFANQLGKQMQQTKRDIKAVQKRNFLAPKEAEHLNKKTKLKQIQVKSTKMEAQKAASSRQIRITDEDEESKFESENLSSSEVYYDENYDPFDEFSLKELRLKHREKQDETNRILQSQAEDYRGTFDEDKIKEMMKPSLQEVSQAVNAQLEVFEKHMDEFKDRLDLKVEELIELNQVLHSNYEECKQEVKATQQSFKDVSQSLRSELKLELDIVTKNLELDRTETNKLKQSLKLQVREEVEKLKGLDSQVRHEFKRTNSLIAKVIEAINLLAEDQMLSQLLQEQDLLDKKQISLMGFKTNQQLIGKNQYAMQNNLISSPKGKEDKDTNTDIWKLRNKKISYSNVVRSVQDSALLREKASPPEKNRSPPKNDFDASFL